MRWHRSFQAVSVLLELNIDAGLRQARTTSTRPWWTHLSFKLQPHSPLLVRLDDDVILIKVLDDEALLIVHVQQDLLDCRVTVSREIRVVRQTENTTASKY